MLRAGDAEPSSVRLNGKGPGSSSRWARGPWSPRGHRGPRSCGPSKKLGRFRHTPVSNVFPRLKLVDASLQRSLPPVSVQPGSSPDPLPSPTI